MNAEKVEKYVQSVLEALREGEEKGKTTLSRQISTLVRKAGQKKRSPKLMATYTEEFERMGVYCDVELEDMGLPLKSKVHFSLSEMTPIGPGFAKEGVFEQFMANRLGEISKLVPGVGKLYLDHGGGQSQKVYHLEGENLKPDMVLHTHSGRRVVVELKKGPPPRSAVNQLTSYISAVARHYAVPETMIENSRKCVAGLLLTGQAKSEARRKQILHELSERRQAGFDIHWAYYELPFNVTNMTPP